LFGVAVRGESVLDPMGCETHRLRDTARRQKHRIGGRETRLFPDYLCQFEHGKPLRRDWLDGGSVHSCICCR
jgi:hypothetical protein